MKDKKSYNIALSQLLVENNVLNSMKRIVESCFNDEFINSLHCIEKGETTYYFKAESLKIDYKNGHVSFSNPFLIIKKDKVELTKECLPLSIKFDDLDKIVDLTENKYCNLIYDAMIEEDKKSKENIDEF